jgi:hypothetical protein
MTLKLNLIFLIVTLMLLSNKMIGLFQNFDFQNELNTSTLATNSAQSSTIIMDANYDNNQRNSGYSDIECPISSFDRWEISRIRTRGGSGCIKHSVNKSDEPASDGSRRTESDNMNFLPARINPNQTRYYGFSIYIPYSWENDGKWDDILVQWKGFSVAPFMFITEKNNNFVFRHNYNTSVNPQTGTMVKLSKTLAPVIKGIWHDFRIKVVWQYQNNGLGNIQIEYKTENDFTYTNVYSYAGPTMLNASGYLKWGIYKTSWYTNTIGTYTASAIERTVYHDNVRIGNSWEEVDPSK